MWNQILSLAGCCILGALIGVALRMIVPDSCRRFSRWSQSKQRRHLFVVAAIFFFTMGASAFANGDPAIGSVGLLMFALEIIALVIVLKRKPSTVL